MVTTNEPNIYETGVLDSNAEGNFVYTTLDAAINWIRKNSLWPMPMGLSCCAIEFMAVACSRYDLSRRAGAPRDGPSFLSLPRLP